MFLQVSVILFTGEGGVCHTPWQADTLPAGRHTPGKQTSPPWANTPLAGKHNPGRHPLGRQSPGTVTTAEGTHPTGMHSCCVFDVSVVGGTHILRVNAWMALEE